MFTSGRADSFTDVTFNLACLLASAAADTAFTVTHVTLRAAARSFHELPALTLRALHLARAVAMVTQNFTLAMAGMASDLTACFALVAWLVYDILFTEFIQIENDAVYGISQIRPFAQHINGLIPHIAVTGYTLDRCADFCLHILT